MKILIDMNLSPDWIPFLRAGGFEAEHWSTVGDPRAADRQIMGWARTRGCVVLTHDLDFSALLEASGQNEPSISEPGSCPPPSVKRFVLALGQFSSQLVAGAIVVVDFHGNRVRLLSLR
jgi:predicted nuclease of predicted toxin-antitoxin system